MSVLGALALVAAAATPALAADNTPPTKPTNNHVTAVTETTVSLAWNKSTDNVGVTEYDVFKQGQFMLKVGGTALKATVTKLTPGTQFVFTIVARDAAGNASGASNTVSVTTPAQPAATGSVAGMVTNKSSGAPLSGVKVAYIVNGAKKSTTTDSSGHYIIGGLPPATYNITFSVKNKSSSATATVSAGQTTTVNASM